MLIGALWTGQWGWADSLPAGQKPVYPDTIYFELTDRERKQLDLAVREDDKSYFTLGVRLKAGGKAHKAERTCADKVHYDIALAKSYTLDMPGQKAWHLLPDSPANDYYLISMCQDKDYLRTATVLRLWKSEGLFPIEFRYVELILDGQSRGLYMLMEKPADALPRKLPSLQSIVRRRFVRTGTVPEIKYSTTNETISTGDYVNAFLDLDHLDESSQVYLIRSRLDLDQYLRHLAVASVLHNGDYVDEIWFLQKPYSVNEGNGYRYEIMKWDPDDVLSACHFGGKYAWFDPFGIAICAESEIARTILGNSLLYPRFVAEVKRLLENALSPENVERAMNQTVTELTARLVDEDMIAPMEQFQEDTDVTVDIANAIAQIRQNRSELLSRYHRHHRSLTARVRAYYRSQ